MCNIKKWFKTLIQNRINIIEIIQLDLQLIKIYSTSIYCQHFLNKDADIKHCKWIQIILTESQSSSGEKENLCAINICQKSINIYFQ